ncbi:MAG: HAD family phosphatase [archaeon]
MQKRSFDGFIFDLDGTLVDFGMPNHEQHFVFKWAKHLGYDEKKALFISQQADRNERIKALGVSEEKYVNELLPIYARVDLSLRKELLNNGSLTLKKGALELLSALKQPKALVSHAPGESVKATIEHLGLEKFFDFVFFRDYSAPQSKELRKPNPQLAFLACEKMNVRPSSKIAIVGDGSRDVKMAKNAGMTSVVVYSKVEGADYYFDDLLQFKKWLGL